MITPYFDIDLYNFQVGTKCKIYVILFNLQQGFLIGIQRS